MNPQSVRTSYIPDRSSQSEIRNPQSAIRNVVAGGLMFAVAFTALALGTVEAWSVAIFELVTLILLLLWMVKAIVDKRIEINFPKAAFPLGAFVLLAVIQGIAFTGSRTSALSMDVEATRGASIVIFFLLVSFLIASNFFNTVQQLHSLANFLITFGLILAVFALIQHFTWEGRLFWFRPMTAAGAGLGGPFVNRNHFAGYMEMLIPLAVALALCRAVRNEARALYAFAAALMGIAEVASLSRGGLVSLGTAMLFVAAVSTRMRQRLVRGSRIEDRGSRGRDVSAQAPNFNRPSPIVYPLSSRIYPAVFVLLIVVAIGAGMYWVGIDNALAERLATDRYDATATSRQVIWKDTLSMISAHPVLGVGVGAYQTVFPMYGHSEGSTIVEFAHNDYLQTLADGGIVAGALAIWFIIVIFRAFARGTKSRDPVSSTLALGAGAGIFAILVHSLFDFNLQLPSNALLFLVLAAIVVTTGAEESLIAKSPRFAPSSDRPAAPSPVGIRSTNDV